MTISMQPARFAAEEVWLPFSESLFEWDDRFHALMLNDRIRVTAYQAAIRKAVKPGMTVLDLGTGTGILALWALEAGARRVYGIEMNSDILGMAVSRIEAAGYGDKFVPISKLSFDVCLPERVDVLISEIIGNLADNENFVPILADATQRFLAPQGIQIPRQVTSYLVPVEAKSAHEQIRMARWRAFSPEGGKQDSSSSATQQDPFNLYYDVILPCAAYLGEPQVQRRYLGSWLESPSYTVRSTWRAGRGGVLTGFKGYFVADLGNGVTLDISGDDVNGHMSSDSWKHAYLPIQTPIALEPDDELRLEFARTLRKSASAWGRQAYSWSGQVQRLERVVGGFRQRTV